MKQKLKALAIFALSFILLYLVFRKVGLQEIADTLQNADPRWLFISLLLDPLLLWVSVIKWRILLRSQNEIVGMPRLMGLYMVGRFFNNFLPTTVGGDVVRGYELGTLTKNFPVAFASIFMERFTGLVTLVIMALASLLTNYGSIADFRMTLAIVISVAGLLGILWIILDERPLMLIERWISIRWVQKYLPKFKKVHSSVNAYREDRPSLVLALIWSLIFNFLAILNVYASAHSFHDQVSFTKMIIIVPIILVVSMLPLTFNGLGLQEWAYVVLFSWTGLPASVGLLTIILIRGKGLVIAAMGGILYPFIKLSKDPIPTDNQVNKNLLTD